MNKPSPLEECGTAAAVTDEGFKSLLRKAFDLLRNSSLTVPMYADRLELLALAASVASASLPKQVLTN